MKKIVKVIIILVILGTAVLTLSGCGTSRYRKAVQRIQNEKEYVNQSIKNIEELNRQRENMTRAEDIVKNAKENANR